MDLPRPTGGRKRRSYLLLGGSLHRKRVIEEKREGASRRLKKADLSYLTQGGADTLRSFIE